MFYLIRTFLNYIEILFGCVDNPLMLLPVKCMPTVNISAYGAINKYMQDKTIVITSS